MKTKEERERRKQSRANFIKMALRRGVPKREAAAYFDEQQRFEDFEAEQLEKLGIKPIFEPHENN